MAKFDSVKAFDGYKAPTKKSPTTILVGMGTCGIAAGASKVKKKLEEQIAAKGLTGVEIKSVGCLGLCFSEPNIEVLVDGMPQVLYGKVDEDMAVKIVDSHLLNKTVLDENIIDKPYIDIINQ